MKKVVFKLILLFILCLSFLNFKCISPELSDGGKIAFSSNRDVNHQIYIMNADGSNQKRLTFNDKSDNFPSFSPDGSKIIFQNDQSGQFHLYLINLEGTNIKQLTFGTNNNKFPCFSGKPR